MRERTCSSITSGPRVVDAHVRESMRQVLGEIRDGTFAREWIAEMEAGEPRFRELRTQAAEQPLERVGRELRALMTKVEQEPHGVR